jgi:hypothetical protein
MHVSTVLGFRRKHRVTPKMSGALVKSLTNRNCYLACMRHFGTGRVDALLLQELSLCIARLVVRYLQHTAAYVSLQGGVYDSNLLLRRLGSRNCGSLATGRLAACLSSLLHLAVLPADEIARSP